MIRCPNCEQRTSGIDYCEWCKYPLLKGSEARRRKAQKQAEERAKLAAKEEARRASPTIKYFEKKLDHLQKEVASS